MKRKSENKDEQKQIFGKKAKSRKKELTNKSKISHQPERIYTYNILELPPELLAIITYFLDYKNLFDLSLVCKSAHSLVSDSFIWQHDCPAGIAPLINLNNYLALKHFKVDLLPEELFDLFRLIHGDLNLLKEKIPSVETLSNHFMRLDRVSVVNFVRLWQMKNEEQCNESLAYFTELFLNSKHEVTQSRFLTHKQLKTFHDKFISPSIGILSLREIPHLIFTLSALFIGIKSVIFSLAIQNIDYYLRSLVGEFEEYIKDPITLDSPLLIEITKNAICYRNQTFQNLVVNNKNKIFKLQMLNYLFYPEKFEKVVYDFETIEFFLRHFPSLSLDKHELGKVSRYKLVTASVCNNKVYIVDRLLQVSKKDLNATFKKGWLYISAENNYIEMAKLLIKYGAKVNLSIPNMTPLNPAIQKGHFEMVKLLVPAAKKEKNPKNNSNMLHHSALMLAIGQGYFEIAEYLFAEGFLFNDLNVKERKKFKTYYNFIQIRKLLDSTHPLRKYLDSLMVDEMSNPSPAQTILNYSGNFFNRSLLPAPQNIDTVQPNDVPMQITPGREPLSSDFNSTINHNQTIIPDPPSLSDASYHSLYIPEDCNWIEEMFENDFSETEEKEDVFFKDYQYK